MKLYFQMLNCVALLLTAQIANAQPSASPTPSATVAPTAGPSSSPQVQLIPAPLPPPAGEPALPSPPPDMPELSEMDALFKQSSMGKEADDFKRHAEWRKLANQIAGDKAIVAAKDFATAATTDLEKRKRLGVYYNLYFDRLKALASTPELKDYLEARRADHLGNLDQPKVRPTPGATQSPAH